MSRLSYIVTALLGLAVIGFSCTKKETLKVTPAGKGGEFITDPVFRQHCLDLMDDFDKDNDGVFSEKDAARITELYLDGYRAYKGGIKSLEGIEYFTGLVRLSFGDNSVEEVDLTHNTALTALDCSRNNLTELDLSANTQIKTLNCSQNQLTEINVTGLSRLAFFSCGNNRLTTLDVSKNTLLEELTCDGWERGVDSQPVTITNAIGKLDAGANTKLTTLSCRSNAMTELILPKGNTITRLDCGNNELPSLDVTGFAGLTVLTCSGNKLTELDLSGCKKLATLDCADNKLDKLDVTGTSILTLNCRANVITELDLAGCSKLNRLDCTGNKLDELDISYCVLLRWLSFSGNTEGMTLYVDESFDKDSFLVYEASKDTTVEIRPAP